ncbi:MAG: hypothetical protein OER90_18835 [Gemmatimonadota bacterium]|nr:hypothetical protein [Gemmatimonadota bacterium]
MVSIPRCCSVLVLVLASLIAVGPRILADAEITLHAGGRFGGEADAGTIRVDALDAGPAFGLSYHHRLREQGWLWGAWSAQRTEFDTPGLLPDRASIDLDVHYLHAGTSYRPQGRGRTQGFVMFGLGLTWVDPRPSEFDTGLGGSLLIGGGFRVAIRPAVAFRLDARGYATFTDTELKGRCGDSACSIDFAGSGPFQVDVLAGVSFAF